MLIAEQNIKIAVIGLGYVGLPVAIAFGNKFTTLGFDINQKRLQALVQHKDLNNEISTASLSAVANLSFTSEVSDLVDCNVYIVTVPTPIDSNCNPDFIPLIKASTAVSGSVKTRKYSDL